MLLTRYFFFVGAVLLALLFVADAELPKLAAVNTADAANTGDPSDLSAIRIKSDRKWPARVVFDTRIPQPSTVQTANNDDQTAAPAKVADISASATARESFAQLAPSASKQSDLKPREIKRHQKRRIARRRVPAPTVLAARQAPFGFFTNNIW